MGVINSKQYLSAFAYSAHRREEILGRREVSSLRRFGLVAQRMNFGDNLDSPAQQAATLGGSRLERVSFDSKPHGFGYANRPNLRLSIHSAYRD
jgi:hypothetical protein